MRIRTMLAATALCLATSGAPALAQEPLFLRPVPSTSNPPVSPGFVLVPPAVYGGPGYGLSGYGYYFDEPSEGPLGGAPAGRRLSVHLTR